MRFFGGKREEKEIKEFENLLYFFQSKEEFWSKDIFHNPEFDLEFENMLNSFSVNVNQAINFYEVLGGNKLEMENFNESFLTYCLNYQKYLLKFYYYLKYKKTYYFKILIKYYYYFKNYY